MKILTVGDGDLSFSLALARCYSTQVDLTATTLVSSEKELLKTYQSASDILHELRTIYNSTICFNIDATKLNELFPNIQFDLIIFNHPHLGYDDLSNESKHAQKHHTLISHYFHSAKSIINETNGLIHLCLCGEQSKTWMIMAAAERLGLTLLHCSSTTKPLHEMLQMNGNEKLLIPQPLQHGWQAPRRYRNDKLGSRHYFGKFGYIHRRTYGDLHAGKDKDMNVTNSKNLLFAISHPNTKTITNNLQCEICHECFLNSKLFDQHKSQPARPDPLLNNQTKLNQSNFDHDEIQFNSNKKKKVSSNDHLISFHETINNTSKSLMDIKSPHPDGLANRVAIVQIEGKRLRWWARQSTVFGRAVQTKQNKKQEPLPTIQSKKHCETIIKGGEIFINGKPVLDSSRILHIGDKVLWIPSKSISIPHSSIPNCHWEKSKAFVHIIKKVKNDIYIIWKPVGIRSCGAFDTQSVESIISNILDMKVISLTRLEIGCSGLCVVVTNTNSMNNSLKMNSEIIEKDRINPHLDISYHFIALIHGNPPKQWDDGIHFELPIDGDRNWRNTSKTKKDHSNLSSSDTARIQLLESTTIIEDKISLSTIQITCSKRKGKLCNSLCYMLRKMNYPVVGDRFCKQELALLPRYCRNKMKSKLHIGCFGIKTTKSTLLDSDEFQFQIPTPERFLSSHWKDIQST